MTLRWGIASAGKISNDFAAALHLLPKNDHELIAIAARSKESAQVFADRHKIPKAYEGYVELAKDPDIDVVYIGAINTQHLSISKLMLEHGKHVLCEKPLAINEKQSKELIELSKSKNLFLMEAIWSRCFPAYAELKRQIDSGIIGDVLFCNVTFGFAMQEKERITSKELGGGGMLDLGVYALQFIQFVFRDLKLEKVVGAGHLNSNGVDDITSGVLVYSGGKTATFTCCTKGLLPNEAIVVGSLGTIKMPTFWCPSEIITPEKTIEFDAPRTYLDVNPKGRPKGGLSYEAEEVRRCIKEGLLESPAIPHSETLELSKLMDFFRKEVGVVFPEDL